MTFFNEPDSSGYCSDYYTHFVDSGDRDLVQYPNSNSYAINLPMELRNIKKLELRSVHFVNAQYAITDNNNIVVIRREDTVGLVDIITKVAIQNGTYTGAALATQLQSQLGAAPPGGGGINITFDEDTGQLQFSRTAGTKTDTLLIASSQISGDPASSMNLMWDNLGLGSRTADFELTSTPEAAGEIIDSGPDRSLIMEIGFPNILQGHMRSTSNHQQHFATILFDTDSKTHFEGFVDSRTTDFVSQAVDFRNIGRLQFIRFIFRRPNGDLVDFGNYEHSFSLRITTK